MVATQVIIACVTIDKDLLEFIPQNLIDNVILFSHITYIMVVYYTCYHIAYFGWLSPIKVATLTSCLLRSRDAMVIKLMLSCREFICAQSPITFLSYLFRQKSYTAQSALGVFSPICNTRVKRLVEDGKSTAMTRHGQLWLANVTMYSLELVVVQTKEDFIMELMIENPLGPMLSEYS